MERAPRSTGLIADIGGTHARFALVDLAAATPGYLFLRTVATKDHPDIASAAQSYLSEMKLSAAPKALVFAVAGPVSNNRIHLTNAGWRIAGDELRAALRVETALLVNDFEAIAQSVPYLGAKDLHAIGQAPPFDPRAEGTVAIVGPGTGLGVGGLVRTKNSTVALVTEGGHAAFAPGDGTEIKVLEILMRKFGHVSAERLLSGPGLLNLYGALAEIAGRRAGDAAPERITQAAQNDPSSFEAEVFARFCAILGSVAGDVALTMGARQGVLIAGGILPAVAPLLMASGFRARFETKGRFADYMKAIPTALIMDPHAGLVGASAILMRLVHT